MRIAIVGAGVAGCIMARSLARLHGADVVCLERVSRDDHSHSGTGLNIGPNAVQALQAHDAPLADAITSAAFPWKRWRTSLTDGTVLFDLPLSQVANNDGWRIRWSELYRVLRDAAASTISYDCAITHVGPDQNPAQSIVEWTEHGAAKRLDKIDLLIGTDGRYSQVRRAFSGEPPPHFVGVAISRVLVPDTSNGLIDDYEQWFNGPNRLLAFRVPPDHVYIATASPIAPDSPVPDRLKHPDVLRAAYTPHDRPLSAQARWLLDAVCTNAADLHWARMQQHELLYAEPRTQVLYLGDAAHGMVPTLGQGATQAIEDASIAAGLIAQHWQAGERDPRQWLASIEQLRRERVGFAMEFSLAATDTLLDGADPVAGTLHKTEAAFLGSLRRLYCEIPSQGSVRPKNETIQRSNMR